MKRSKSSPGKSDRYSPILVFGLTWINLIDPLEDAALEVEHPLEPHGTQEIGRFCAPTAHLAVHDNFFLRVELGIPPRPLAERDELSAWDPVDLPLVRLPDVDDPEL